MTSNHPGHDMLQIERWVLEEAIVRLEGQAKKGAFHGMMADDASGLAHAILKMRDAVGWTEKPHVWRPSDMQQEPWK